MNYDDLLSLVQKRRSIRKLKPEPIPNDYVDKIIEVARWSPSGANSQPWEFIVVKKQELKDRIVELVNEHSAFMRKIEAVREPELRFKWVAAGYVRAPVFIILCGDPRTKDAYPLMTVAERGSSHFTSSLASCFLYMNLAASSLGLGTQWVSAIAHHYVQTLTKDLLKVPRELEFYDMMAVGYPDMEPRPRLLRARQDMIHYDCFDQQKFRTDQQTKDFIARLRR
jgi:nitroreductase